MRALSVNNFVVDNNPLVRFWKPIGHINNWPQMPYSLAEGRLHFNFVKISVIQSDIRAIAENRWWLKYQLEFP